MTDTGAALMLPNNATRAVTLCKRDLANMVVVVVVKFHKMKVVSFSRWRRVDGSRMLVTRCF